MVRKIHSTKKTAQRRAELEKMHNTVIENVEALRKSDSWSQFLKFAQAFHRYSVNNMMLILAQKPEATQVASYTTWQKLGRQVRAGEGGPNAIRIFGGSDAYKTIEDEETGEEKRIHYVKYFPTSVFDISQTDPIEGAAPAPELAKPLEGEDPAGICEATTDYLASLGWTVTREPIPGAAYGYTTTDGSKRIVVDENVSPAQAAKTTLHEAAHALLHANEDHSDYITHRGLKETEAESVAYVVAGSLGLDTSDYSIGYIAGWSNCDTETIKSAAANVLRAAHKIADAITETEEAATAA